MRGKCDLCGEMWSDGMSIGFMPLRGGGFAEPRIGSGGAKLRSALRLPGSVSQVTRWM